MADLTRKTFNLPARSIEAIAKLRAVDEHNETDTISRALLLHSALLDYMVDGTLTIVDQDGNPIKLLVI